MTYTNRLKLPLLYIGQAQKEITHNEALNLLDVLVNPVAQEININSPPTDLKIGKLYVIGLEPTGEFKDHKNKIAQRLENSWRFIKPQKWLEIAYSKDGTKYRFTGKEWEQVGSILLPVRTNPQTSNEYLIKKDTGEYLQVLHLEEERKLIGEFTESTIQIPHHSIVIAVNVRVIEEITGAASFSIGTFDDPKRYGSNIASTKDTTNAGQYI
ncbi:MAG TPA: DUF2793 domain-containing protein [Rickettsia endosymbiont of Omalisus fontisbellaquei]|nr:DUF2793 domain-containing protein [Rickettsia endosymbiont of Omalisus fontisbellaquei]